MGGRCRWLIIGRQDYNEPESKLTKGQIKIIKECTVLKDQNQTEEIFVYSIFLLSKIATQIEEVKKPITNKLLNIYLNRKFEQSTTTELIKSITEITLGNYELINQLLEKLREEAKTGDIEQKDKASNLILQLIKLLNI